MGRSRKSSVDLAGFTPIKVTEPVKFIQLFDWFLMSFGVFCSILNGILSSSCLFAFLHLQDVQIRGQTQFDSKEGLHVNEYTTDTVKWCSIYTSFGVIMCILGYISTFCWLKLSERQAYRIKTQFLKRVLNQEMGFFNQNEVGMLTQRLSAGIERVKDGTGDKLGFILQAISNTITGLIVAAIMSWQIAFLMLLFMPFIILSICLQSASIKSSLREESKANDEANAVSQEVLSSIRTVGAFNAQEFEVKRYGDHLDVAYRFGVRKSMFTSVFTGSFELISFMVKDSIEKSKRQTTEAVEWRQLMRYATKFDWFLLAAGLMFSVLNGFLAPLSLFAFQHLTDIQIRGQKQFDSAKGLDTQWFTRSIIEWAIIYFTFGVVLFIVGYGQTRCFIKLSDRQAHQIKLAFMRSVLNQDSTWFQTTSTGYLTQKLSSWKISIVMFLTCPIVVFAIWGSTSAVKSSIRKEMKASGLASSIVEEVLSSIRTVAAFNAQKFELKRYSLQLDEGYRCGIRSGYVSALFSSLFELINFTSMGCAVCFGSLMVIEGKITPGTVFSVYWAVICGANRLGKSIPYFAVLMKARIAAADLFEIIDRKPDLDSSSQSGARPDGVECRLKFKDVCFHYPTRPEVAVLKGVSFNIESGETIALVGHSGSGKSTIVKLLMRFFDVIDGEITLGDIPLNKINIQWLRTQIGIVAQDPVIFSGTVEENMRMAKENLTHEEMVEACKLANIHDVIMKLPEGYKTRINAGGVVLSGGQRQRLAIARTLARNPKILLLDEATSALDVESERLVQEAIDKAQNGRTTIIIAHRLSTIRNAHRIIVFDHGKIVEIGSHDELMAQPNTRYKQLIQAQRVERRPEETKSPKFESSGFKRGKFQQSTKSASSVSTYHMTEIEQERSELKAEGGTEASFGQIWSYAKQERKFLGSGIFLAALRGHTWPVYALILGHFFHSMSMALAGGNTETLRINAFIDGGILASLGVVAAILCVVSSILLSVGGERFTKRLRLDVFKNLLKQDGAFYDNPLHTVGKLSARLAMDAPNVQAAMDQRLGDVLQGLISLFCGLAIGFYFGWKMALIECVNSFVFLALQLLLVELQKRKAIADAEALDEAFHIASESIENVQTIQALTKQDYVYDRFCNASVGVLRLSTKRANLQALLYGLIQGVEELHLGIAYLCGLVLIRSGHATPFAVFQVIEAVNMGLMGFFVVASYVPEYLRARVSAGLMFQMVNRPALIDSMSDNGKMPLISGQLRLNEICFAYPNARTRPILNDFKLEVEAGQTVALVGQSGCGKSTVVQLLERYYDVLSGSLEIDNVDIKEINLKHLRESMSIVQQEPTLFNLTIAQNIGYGMKNLTIDQVIAAAKLANVFDFINSLPMKFDTLIGPHGSQLSGGQKQRIAIARSLIRNPKILLLDEATSALDTQSEKLVQEALDKATEGRTCLIVAHRLSTIRSADRIVVVKDGRVVEQGKHEELIEQKGVYYRLIKKQAEILN
ncbi:Multidrug resistance protein pgp-3 [Aphelenchoides besseyi]|nr:Multidrug resistance protein pgp-3 [Aphelenchoides besseyi]